MGAKNQINPQLLQNPTYEQQLGPPQQQSNINTMPSLEQQNNPGPRFQQKQPNYPASIQQGMSQLNLAPGQSMAPPPNFTRPPYAGRQQNLPGPPFPGPPQIMEQPKQPNLPPTRPPMSRPPFPGQQYPNYPPQPQQNFPRPPQAQQKVYPGYHQQPPPPQTNYQQPDMYNNNQRNQYQSGGYRPVSPVQQQAPNRLDPDQMPSPICVMQEDQRTKGGVFVINQKGLVPPLVTTEFVAQDQGNASPRYIRSTMYTVPTTADIIKQANIPFGLIISPMANLAEGEYEPPIVDMGENGPIRCVRCKAYMSPFMQFIDAGRRFQCAFCEAINEVPTEYFSHLDYSNLRMDRMERPELVLGTYEFTTTKDYCRNNVLPKAPAIVFVIDVSFNTIKSGLIPLLCNNMKTIIKNFPVDVSEGKTKMKVGFITYNNTVHFYNINPSLAQPQMMVVGDVEDMFMPFLDGFLCDADESDLIIDSLMSQIPEMFANTQETETILAPAIQAGLEALKGFDCPGKLLVFHSSLPIAEAPGKLKNRDERKLLGTDQQKTVLSPQTNVYNNLAQKCVEVGCSVDLFVLNNSYVDVATIGQVAKLTGGEIYKYTYFQADLDGKRLIQDIIKNVSRKIAFDSVMRVRTSTGIRPTEFYGHMFMSNTTDMELASIDSDKALAIEIKHDDKLPDDGGVYIQTALLYTSCAGVRRLRIINLSLKTSAQIIDLFRACDQDAIMCFLSKQCVFKLLDSTPKTIKDHLVTKCANILATYRQHCCTNPNAGQLILPECMKLLPLYVNCLLKSDAISGGPDMTVDDKSFVMQTLTIMPVAISVGFLYPRLISLHDLDVQELDLPPRLRCSFERFAEDGAYLLENSVHMFLWLGPGLSPQWLQAVFGVASLMEIENARNSLPVFDNPLNRRIHQIVNRIQGERPHCMRLTLVHKYNKLEMVLRHFLIEDGGMDGSQSYVDFLCHIHKKIRTLLSQ